MIFRRKSLSLRILITLTVFLAGCGSPLLKAENPLIKADTDFPQTEISPTSPPTQVESDIDPTQQEPETEEERSPDMITITLVYDNYPYRSGLRTDWGFSAFITDPVKFLDDLIDLGGAGIAQVKTAQNQVDILFKFLLCFQDNILDAWMGAARDHNQTFGCVDHQSLLWRRTWHLTNRVHPVYDLHARDHFDQFDPAAVIILEFRRE